ncbi:hypothetical protein ABPG74_017879 [Tetrahymena malaccensis]
MNVKDISHSSGQSGTTGLLSTKKKKNAIYIKNMYLIRECMYKGQFHNTYKGFNKTNKQPVIIKMSNQYYDHISNENKMVKLLKEVSCTPKILHVGEEKINGTNYFVKITESYGPSLKILFSLMKNNLSISTICMFGIAMLNVLEEIHSVNIVHRNLKPKKIVIHNDLKSTQLYLVDFKYARKYKHKNGQLVRYNENNRIMNKIFCNKFSSIGTHLGITPSRKDDLESLGYILIYLTRKGNLFGNKHFKTREEKLKYYEEQKLSLIPETLGDMPAEFVNYLNYIKSMNIMDHPEYDVWRKTFKQLFLKSGGQLNDYQFEWTYKIKNEMVSQFGNSFLQDLDTPNAISLNQKDANSKFSQNYIENEEKNKDVTLTTNHANPEETTAFQTRELKQSDTTISALPQINNTQEQTQNNINNQINNDGHESLGAGVTNYYYGPVEIDMNDIQAKQTIQSNMTFGQDSEVRNQVQQNNNNVHSNNGSIIDNFSTYNKKSQLQSTQHLNTSQNQVNTSNYSTDDLSICDDETQNSLSSQLSRHNKILMHEPFFFKFKQFD